MSNTNLNDDLLDEGLQAVMGPDRCQNPGDWQPKLKKVPEVKPTEKKLTGKDKPITAQWEPVKPDPNWLDRLKSAAKWTLPWSALCLLVFYWQQADLMASEAAVPSMCFCTMMAGFCAGKYAIK
jgi:hypothetical protein